MKLVRRIRYLCIVLAGCVIAGGCSSSTSTGFKPAEFVAPDAKTISVPIFANDSFYRGVEFDLTEALIKEIELRTPYKVVRGTAADTTLTGNVRAVKQRVLSRAFEGGIGQEIQVSVAANFEWLDMRSGKVLRKRSRVIGTGEYIPARAVGEPLQTGVHDAVSEIARDIVSTMYSDW